MALTKLTGRQVREQLICQYDYNEEESTLRLSMDAKATVKIGSFSRGGKNRVPTSGCDHDYQPSTKLTPYGIFLPELDELFFLKGLGLF